MYNFKLFFVQYLKNTKKKFVSQNQDTHKFKAHIDLTSENTNRNKI